MKSISIRLRVHIDDELAIGPGRIELLEHIERAGSLASAARAMHMSYRRAWLLMRSLNEALREPALESAKGGSSRRRRRADRHRQVAGAGLPEHRGRLPCPGQAAPRQVCAPGPPRLA